LAEAKKPKNKGHDNLLYKTNPELADKIRRESIAGASAKRSAMARLKKLTASELEGVINLILSKNIPQLKELQKKSTTPAMHQMAISVVMSIIKKGDMDSFDKLLSRLIGKVSVKVTHAIETNFSDYSDDQLLKEKQALDAVFVRKE
jgi:hypothetical protein